VKKRLEQDRSKIEAAQNELKKWLEERRAMTKEKIADWKATGEKIKLQGRADFAERYAKATAVVAGAAVDQAEQAALEAWLARKDAESGAKAA